jgi:hypothetical protein
MLESRTEISSGGDCKVGLGRGGAWRLELGTTRVCQRFVLVRFPNIDVVAKVVLCSNAMIPAVDSMWDQELRPEGFSWTSTRVPGGASGVRL